MYSQALHLRVTEELLLIVLNVIAVSEGEGTYECGNSEEAMTRLSLEIGIIRTHEESGIVETGL